MNNKIKRVLAVFLAALLAASLCSSLLVYADDGVIINEANFPDPVWRQLVIYEFDQNFDGRLSPQEAASCGTSLIIADLLDMYDDLAGQGISNLKGIEYFTGIKKLHIGDLGVETVDLSALTRLTKLTAPGNNFTSLDLSHNPVLEDVRIRGNVELSQVVLGSAIKTLVCDNCAFTSLNLLSSPNLEFLNCSSNDLTSLNLSANTKLEFLNCADNHLKDLDLSVCPAITSCELDDQSIVISSNVTVDNSNKHIYVPFTVADGTKIVKTNVDNDVFEIGYNSTVSAFVFTDYSVFETGIEYLYDVNNAATDGMTVNATVEKNFFKVSYLTQENGEEYYYDYVTAGSSMISPSFPEAPENMACPSFSAVAENVTEDMEIYVIWAENHTDVITSFVNGAATVECAVCGEVRALDFADYVNKRSGDSGYEAILDVNNDGIINARDLALLVKEY